MTFLASFLTAETLVMENYCPHAKTDHEYQHHQPQVHARVPGAGQGVRPLGRWVREGASDPQQRLLSTTHPYCPTVGRQGCVQGCSVHRQAQARVEREERGT